MLGWLVVANVIGPAAAADPEAARAVVVQYYQFQGTEPDEEQIAAGVVAAGELLDEGVSPEDLSGAVVRVHLEVEGAKKAAFELIVPAYVRAGSRSTAEPDGTGTPESPSDAGCVKDVDCKGDRICVDGACVEPEPLPEWAEDPDIREWHQAGRNASVAGVISGFANIGPVLSITTAAAIVGTGDEYMALGVMALGWAVTSVPITAGLASEVRRQPGVNGDLGARIGGWVIFGSSIGMAAAAIVIGLDGWTPPGISMSIAFLGCGALALHAVDALVGVLQFEALSQRTSRHPDRARRHAVVIWPTVAVTPLGEGENRYYAGVTARW